MVGFNKDNDITYVGNTNSFIVVHKYIVKIKRFYKINNFC